MKIVKEAESFNPAPIIGIIREFLQEHPFENEAHNTFEDFEEYIANELFDKEVKELTSEESYAILDIWEDLDERKTSILESAQEEKESNIIRFIKGEFTKNELAQLRSDVVLNSIYTSDYENRFNIDPAFVQDFFDGYVDFMLEDESEDTIDNLENWYYTVDYSDYVDDPSKLEVDYSIN